MIAWIPILIMSSVVAYIPIYHSREGFLDANMVSSRHLNGKGKTVSCSWFINYTDTIESREMSPIRKYSIAATSCLIDDCNLLDFGPSNPLIKSEESL